MNGYALFSNHSIRALPGQRFIVTDRPKMIAIRVTRIEIMTHPSAWRVHDIKVGDRSQFGIGAPYEHRARDLPIVGSEFTARNAWALETCQTAMDMSMEIEYVGENPEGEHFRAEMTGPAVV